MTGWCAGDPSCLDSQGVGGPGRSDHACTIDRQGAATATKSRVGGKVTTGDGERAGVDSRGAPMIWASAVDDRATCRFWVNPLNVQYAGRGTINDRASANEVALANCQSWAGHHRSTNVHCTARPGHVAARESTARHSFVVGAIRGLRSNAASALGIDQVNLQYVGRFDPVGRQRAHCQLSGNLGLAKHPFCPLGCYQDGASASNTCGQHRQEYHPTNEFTRTHGAPPSGKVTILPQRR